MGKIKSLHQRLRRLRLFETVALRIVARISSIYKCAKNSVGPFSAAVSLLEGIAVACFLPSLFFIYISAYHLISYADDKVDKTMNCMEMYVPLNLKSSVRRAYKAVEEQGLVRVAKNAARRSVMWGLESLLKQPEGSTIAGAMLRWADKYNSSVVKRKVGFLPLAPVHRLALILNYRQSFNAAQKAVDAAILHRINSIAHDIVDSFGEKAR